MKVSQNVEVINRLGLHARACARLVKTTAEFDAQVEVRAGDHVCDGKSIMGLMMLAATQGTHICVTADGDDAQACLLYTSPRPRDYAASRMPSSA